MESSVASYLHKKFKKHQQYSNNRPISFDMKFSSNTESKPTTANNMSSIFGNAYSKTKPNNSFDMKFSNSTEPKPTTTANMSSIFVTNYSKTNCTNKTDEIGPQNQPAPEDYQIKDELFEIKPEEIQPPPDRNPNGKYVCTFCNLVCSKPSVLQKHIRAHTNERPYPCISCGFRFKTRSNLYKHCRSRTHANRVMGNRAQELNESMEIQKNQTSPNETKSPPPHQSETQADKINQDVKMKPYKPRFHSGSGKQFFENIAKENIDDDRSDEGQVNHKNPTSDILSHHINEIINKNSSIVNNNDFVPWYRGDYNSNTVTEPKTGNDEPLNLTNKNRKRCMSEVAEPIVQKSLIKELLLKNLYSDMQCPYCKMIFQTVTELELHKLRSCKGKPSGVKYTRSSSVNVASILTQNKNAFDNIPQLQNTLFPLNSPGPFLGKTRLVDSDKNKSFSFEDGLRGNLAMSPSELSPLCFDKEKKIPVKLFGGEVKITHTSGETKTFKIDQESDKFDHDGSFMEYGGKLSENRVVKSSLQSGGTVLTNKINSPSYKYSSIMDFSQNAVKLLTPNIRQPNLHVPGIPGPQFQYNMPRERHVEQEKPAKLDILEVKTDLAPPPKIVEMKSPIPNKIVDLKSPVKTPENKPPTTLAISMQKKIARPNSLALKPTTACLKQHHGLTPTMFNQILISPDTPRVAKKYAQHFLHGNYFSYLGLKSSTKPVYCTLNKTQPFYVPHFQKLSMYSEWRQQDTKTDKLYVSGYDSRQKSQKYTTAGKPAADLIIHSSYKFIVSELPSSKVEKGDDQQKASVPIPGGYESYEDYTYIRGRGRGRYVCDQCGIRCKKPSMLKKHIRTHSNDRPYTCSHCNFSFKTKGNLTKHMKSKAHTKNYTASSSSGSSTQQSGTQSSESDTDDSGMDSSDESTRQQEHEAAYGLLSLSQKTTQNVTTNTQSDLVNTTSIRSTSPTSSTNISDVLMSTDEIAQVSKRNYAKNKILDENTPLNFTAPMNFNKIPSIITAEETKESRNISQFFGKSSVIRPLTYPYTSVLPCDKDVKTSDAVEPMEFISKVTKPNEIVPFSSVETKPKCIKQFHVIQKYAMDQISQPKISDAIKEPPSRNFHEKSFSRQFSTNIDTTVTSSPSARQVIVSQCAKSLPSPVALPTLKINGVVVSNENASDLRKRKNSTSAENSYTKKIQKNGVLLVQSDEEVMDLSMTPEKHAEHSTVIMNGGVSVSESQLVGASNLYLSIKSLKNMNNEELRERSPQRTDINEESYGNQYDIEYKNNEYNTGLRKHTNGEYDNSAMETLADIATKQVKLEKNTLAKSVACEFLKLATKNESGYPDSGRDSNNYSHGNKDVNDLIVKPEGNKSCTICSKSFSKPSQLRLHMNIHYIERPFRCESCSVSFRTKGHLQKHERSASHHNKLSSSPALSSSEPRPFKCTDCNIAFRIHGHLAKHLRSKMHIMKLECLAKIPFGLYAELERSNSLLTEINTCDGDQCLESLKTLAKKVFINDPNKLNQLEYTENIDADS